jgi:predicted GNAT family N-acyltransferase
LGSVRAPASLVDVQVKIERAAAVPDEVHRLLKTSTEREFGHVEIVAQHVWAEPTWLVLGCEGDRIVSFLGIVDRDATADEQPVHLFGLSNVVTEPSERNRGHSRRLNMAAIELMTAQDPAAFGLLFCADPLVSFYGALGWQVHTGRVVVSQPSGDRPWTSNCMFHALGRTQGLDTHELHLRGLPW